MLLPRLRLFIVAPLILFPTAPAFAAEGEPPLPEYAKARLGTPSWRYEGLVHTVAFSPDGKLLASGGQGGKVYLIDATAGQVVRVLPGHKGEVLSVAFLPDGKTLVSGGGDQKVRLWEVATGKEVRVLAGHSQGVVAVATAPDGKLVASGCEDGTILLWDQATGEQVGKLTGHTDGVVDLRFAPDGKRLSSAGYDKVGRVWDVAGRKEVLQLKGHTKPVKCAAFSPDGKLLATSSADGARLWDAATGEELRRLTVLAGEVERCAFAPDGKTLATPTDGTIRLWDVATGKELYQLRGHTGAVREVAFAPDGKSLASAAWDHTVRLWDVATGAARWPGHGGPITCLQFAPSGKILASGSRDASIRLWDATSGKELRVLTEHEHPAAVLHFSADGKSLLSKPTDPSVQVWDLAAGKVTSLALEALEQDGHPSHSTLSPDGKWLAGEYLADRPGKERVVLWDLATRKEVRRLEGEGPLAFSPDSRLLAFRKDGRGQLWDVGSGKKVRSWEPASAIFILGFTPGGHMLAGCDFWEGGSCLCLREVATGELRLRLSIAPYNAASVAFSPDQHFLAWGDDGRGAVYLCDLATGKPLRTFLGHQGAIRNLAFSPDGKTLASGGDDHVVFLWDVADLLKEAGPKPAVLSAKQAEALWGDLRGDDAGRAYQAVVALSAAPEQAVPLLRDRLKPTTLAIEAKRIAQWVAELDHDDFNVRERASRELAKAGPAAEAALRKALAGDPSLEGRTRIEALLQKLEKRELTPDQVRDLRALEVLEQIGSAEAKAVLRKLADGPADADLTREAKASLERLARRTAGRP